MQTGSYTPKGYKVRPTSRTKIREDAHVVLDVIRGHMKLSSPCLPIVDVIEMLDAEDIVRMDILESHLMNGKAAELVPSHNGEPPALNINEDVYEGACDGDNFSRFTLAHELGHYFLHSNQALALTRMQIGPGSASHKAFEDSEWQANTFAGELLVDSRLVSQHCDCPEDISEVFGVSSQTASIQWKGLRKDGIV